MHNIHIFSDFDGTITNEDSLVVVLDRYGDPEWRRFEKEVARGESTPFETLTNETESLKASLLDMVALLDSTVTIRDGFSEFVDFVKQNNIPFSILSGGYLTFIKQIFNNAGKKELVQNVTANDIVADGADSTRWKLVQNSGPKIFPDYPNCKVYPIREAKKAGCTTIYIGDGNTDYMAAKECDIVFARANLAEFMQREKRAFIPFETFFDVVNYLKYKGSREDY